MSESVPTPTPPQPGDLIAQRYRLGPQLGSGSMGWVFDAEDAKGGHVALKLLRPSPALEEDVARFQREAHVGLSLPSPHVVSVLDAGRDDTSGLSFLVMPLLTGSDLGALIQRIGPLSPSVAARIICQAAWGLVAAHRAGIVHRDVKPSNLFLHQDTPDNVVVKLFDFGLARPAVPDQKLTHTGTVLGSPLFMAPEQARDPRQVDERADVWSLAASLYAALTGKAPWEGHFKGLSETLTALITQEVPPIQQGAPWIPTRLAEIVHGALVLDREARCPNVRSLLDALEPRTGGTLQLRPSMLVGITEEAKRQRPAAARLPRSWFDLGNKDGPAAETKDGDGLVQRTVGSGIELTRLLGRGGMGAVYEGTMSGKRVAVKVMLDDINPVFKPDAVKRFVREARAVMAIDNPHVVRVLEADTDVKHGRPYIVMEFLQGQDLDKLIKKHGPMESSPVLRLFIQACHGLQAAHQLGVVHRDIKPANLFVHQLPSGEQVTRICDFGVAKTLLADGEQAATVLTRTGGILGSPMYMSPEQANNSKEVDSRTDIWSLGASLYEALSGHKLWGDALSINTILIRLCTEDPPPLKHHAPWLPVELCDAVHRALRRNPEERYLRADQFAAALEPFARACPKVFPDALTPSAAARIHLAAAAGVAADGKGAAALPKPDNTAEEARKALGQKPWLWVLGAGAVVGAVVGLVATSIGHPARHEIRVVPRDAQVTINGHSAALEDGKVVLQGEPGEAFTITVVHGSRHSQTHVILPRAGPVTPSVIDLTQVPAPSDPGALK